MDDYQTRLTNETLKAVEKTMRHPVAAEYEKALAERKERLDKLLELWRAAWDWREVHDPTSCVDLAVAIDALGPPPEDVR